MPPSEEEAPLLKTPAKSATEEKPPSSSRNLKWRVLTSCTFLNKCSCLSSTFVLLLSVLIAAGVVLGVILMPLYLSKGTANTVTDVCTIDHCNGYEAKVRLDGFQRANVSVWSGRLCSTMLGETRTCFVKLGTVSGKMSVSFERRDVLLAAAFGVTGWAILVPLFAWACVAMVRNRDSVDDCNNNAPFMTSFWTIIGLLIAYGVIAGVIAMPVLVSGGWRWYDNEIPSKDTCLVQSCNAQNFGTVYAETAERTALVYVRDCALHLRKRITCYETSSPGLIVTYKPYRGAIIGLASTAWVINAGLLTWMTVEIFRCARKDLDKAVSCYKH